MQLWPAVCPELAQAPELLAVGDLHIENFGTWRDHEGRLVWGINDFDEAFPLAYTIDLVRLATSALLATRDGQLALAPRVICGRLLEGYSRGLELGGRPYVLEETHGWMRAIAQSSLRDPVPYWSKMAQLPTYRGDLPKKVQKLFAREFADAPNLYRVAHRSAGLGSLGRQRFVALAERHGGMVAREVKALLPSACSWASDAGGSTPLFYRDILEAAVRCPDPFVRPTGKWVLRRLAADCSKLDLSHMPRLRSEERLMRAMGFETANVHLGTRDAIRAVRRDLAKRSSRWLDKAAQAMAQAVTVDWRAWRKHQTAAR
jgi:hypothetical protein